MPEPFDLDPNRRAEAAFRDGLSTYANSAPIPDLNEALAVITVTDDPAATGTPLFARRDPARPKRAPRSAAGPVTRPRRVSYWKQFAAAFVALAIVAGVVAVWAIGRTSLGPARVGTPSSTPSVATSSTPSPRPDPSVPPEADLPVSSTAPARNCDGVKVPAGVNADVCGGVPAGATARDEQLNEVEAYYFTTPSGNIQCDFQTSWVQCLITDYSFSEPPRPKEGCDEAWAAGLVQLRDAGAAEKGSCKSDPMGVQIALWNGATVPKLAYGESDVVGTVVCSSAEDGLTCWNTRTHHGFKLSKTVQLTW